MDSYAVFGNPVGHSKSPIIHRLFAEQTKQAIQYGRQEPQIDQFAASIKAFFAQGSLGANVTAPFKLDAFRYADKLSPRAKMAEAVNTLTKRKDGTIFGDNTDGQGLVQDLERLWGSIDGKRLLLIGAGGATRGVILPLLNAGITSIHIANRTAKKAQDLAEKFSDSGRVSASGLKDIPLCSVEGVINCTSSSLQGGLPDVRASIFSQAEFAYDMTYKSEVTLYMRWANETNKNIAVSDGLGMLVGQAAESFYLWRHVKPDIEPVIQLVRKMM